MWEVNCSKLQHCTRYIWTTITMMKMITQLIKISFAYCSNYLLLIAVNLSTIDVAVSNLDSDGHSLIDETRIRLPRAQPYRRELIFPGTWGPPGDGRSCGRFERWHREYEEPGDRTQLAWQLPLVSPYGLEC